MTVEKLTSNATQTGRISAQTENKSNEPQEEFVTIESVAKSYRYFARWTSSLLRLSIVLTQSFNLQDFEEAREHYFDNTYLPELTSVGRNEYELRKCAKQIVDNLTDAEQILAFKDPNLANIVTKLTWPPFMDMQQEFANIKVVIEAAIVKQVDILKRLAIPEEEQSALQDFIIRQGIRWNKIAIGERNAL